MLRRLVLLTTTALLLVSSPLYAQATLTRAGGMIGVLGPASAFGSSLPGKGSTVSGNVMAAASRTLGRPAMQPAWRGGGCTIDGFIGGLANGSTLNPIGVFDLTGQTTGNFSLGTATPTASVAGGGVLSANLGAAPRGSVAGLVARNAGTLFQYATNPNCGSGAPFTTTLTSYPAGSGGDVVATANTLRMQATYTTQYVADPSHYYCYYTNNPRKIFKCNIWSANVTFNFLTSSFAAFGAGTYSLNIVQATITSP